MARDRSPEDRGKAAPAAPTAIRRKPRRASDEPDDAEAEDALRDATSIQNRRHDPESPDLSVGVDW